MSKKPPVIPPNYSYPDYIRVARKLDAERAWEAWCDYKYTDMTLKEIQAKYDISYVTLYNTGDRFGDKFRRGRGMHKPFPLSEKLKKAMFQDYVKGELPLHAIEAKYGIGQQWIYKVANTQEHPARRRPTKPKLAKRALSPEDEAKAWDLYEHSIMRVADICWEFAIDKSTLYDIGDRLGSTFRRHKSISGAAVTKRIRYARNHRGSTE